MNAHPLQLSHITDVAVGHGIATSFGSEGVHSDTAADWIHYCVKAAMEARAAVLDNPPDVPADTGPAARMLAELNEEFPDDEVEEIGFYRKPAPRALANDSLITAANHAAEVAFRCCMPHLTNRRRVQAYIAVVAVGVQHKFIPAADAKSLLYTAQLALSAHPKRRATTTRKAA